MTPESEFIALALILVDQKSWLGKYSSHSMVSLYSVKIEGVVCLEYLRYEACVNSILSCWVESNLSCCMQQDRCMESNLSSNTLLV